jgi:hypothetical protein
MVPISFNLAVRTIVLILAVSLVVASAISAETGTDNTGMIPAAPTLEETRITMDKWIETQQIISKERKDWQKGKEILLGRLELVKNEIASLSETVRQAESGMAESDKKRDEMITENEKLKEADDLLKNAVMGMEEEVRNLRLFKQLPEPILTKLQPLYQRIPEDSLSTKVSTAERFQNVLGILNELNKANNEIAVSYEVHNLSNGKPSEVKAIYVGLAQAYYVSAGGESGIGYPTAEGWKWEPSQEVSRDVVLALEILDGKHSPAFVPLPVVLK